MSVHVIAAWTLKSVIFRVQQNSAKVPDARNPKDTAKETGERRSSQR